ncbi:unnamed protein product [Amoebophrya sp. A25]|nr:unnamed protein product [Amoebophrya sp. A25]|eukprot:GSA25T00024830001.1
MVLPALPCSTYSTPSRKGKVLPLRHVSPYYMGTRMLSTSARTVRPRQATRATGVGTGVGLPQFPTRGPKRERELVERRSSSCWLVLCCIL